MTNFLMSVRFNKQSPQDFGLVYVNGRFLRENDGTAWLPHPLFDLGWGKENGFYKIPLGSFEELMQLVLCDNDLEDSYGAAAMIQEVYPTELKEFLLDLMRQKTKFRDRPKVRRLDQFFQLHKGTNLTCRVGMSFAEIEKEYDEWRRIAQFFSAR